ncbi:MAG: hypothetical protein MRERV_70c006 [Mycoplasmataceae bacterium RV_VA103A]|nr:MAG: hypothetical protein MRERV_70c006 [Mycoplasmataceae bacterium RV_VA103A]
MNGNEKQNHGVVIAELIDKTVKKDKNQDTFWILKLSICKRLTEMYFELKGTKRSTLLSNDKPLYVFSNRNKNRFGFSLKKGYIYLFWYKESLGEDDVLYLHVERWLRLGNDRRGVEGSYRILLNEKEESEEEEETTNEELLLELKKRIKEQRIGFNLSAADSETEKVLSSIIKEIDADLEDSESNFRLDLMENWREERK